MEILIKNTRLVDGYSDYNGDIYIKEGFIEDIGKHLEYDCFTINGSKLCVMPGFIDMHAHFRDPGEKYKEDLLTGSKSALKGGYTYVNLMYDSKAEWSIKETLDYIYDKNKTLDLIKIQQSIFIGRHKNEDSIGILQKIDPRIKAVVVERSAYIENSMFLKIMKFCKDKDILLIIQAEDRELPKANSRLSEVIETIRVGLLANYSGTKIHFTHVSSKEAVKAIRHLKLEDNNITCDITPHHLASNDIEYKVNPPLKGKEDTEIFIKAIEDGTIDMIATDHAPQTFNDMNKGLTGAIGIEIAFPICYTELTVKNKIGISKLSSLLSGNPSRVLNLNQGYLIKGYKADIILIDLDISQTIDSSKFQSKSINTPFDGYESFGKILMTIVDGKIKFLESSI